MQPAVRIDYGGARPKHEVEGVTQDDVRPQSFQLLGRHRFDRAVRAYRHECRCFDDSMCKGQPTETGRAVRFQYVEYRPQGVAVPLE